MTTDTEQLRRTPLFDLHNELGGKLVPFAGYSMPVQFPAGIMGEHTHARTAAGLFDVSHMGQAWLRAPSGAASLLERLVPGEIQRLGVGRMRYTQLLTEDGGIIDDLMVTKFQDDDGQEELFVVVNGACKEGDFAHIEARLGGEAELDLWPDRGLLALQGPQAAAALAAVIPGMDDMTFMSARRTVWEGEAVIVSRCGYTGEDGYEVSVAADATEALARRLLEQPAVEPVGLGARDSLRLEAGLCLYGNDIDTTTSPVEANLVWSIGKRRREEGGFPGAERILREIAQGPDRLLVGVAPEGRAPARQGAEIQLPGGETVGVVTSGGFGPTCQAPVAMGYVRTDHADPGQALNLIVRGKELPAQVAALPFVPHNYYRG